VDADARVRVPAVSLVARIELRVDAWAGRRADDHHLEREEPLDRPGPVLVPARLSNDRRRSGIDSTSAATDIDPHLYPWAPR
jgi:hypothetical protein